MAGSVWESNPQRAFCGPPNLNPNPNLNHFLRLAVLASVLKEQMRGDLSDPRDQMRLVLSVAMRQIDSPRHRPVQVDCIALAHYTHNARRQGQRRPLGIRVTNGIVMNRQATEAFGERLGLPKKNNLG